VEYAFMKNELEYLVLSTGMKSSPFTSPPLEKGGLRGILRIIYLKNLPSPLFAKEGNTD